MRFKMASRNPFRDFVRNLRRISISKYTDEEKDDLFHELVDEFLLVQIERIFQLRTWFLS